MRIFHHLRTSVFLGTALAICGVCRASALESSALATKEIQAEESGGARLWTPAEIGSGAFTTQPDQTLVYKIVSSNGVPVELKLNMYLPPGYQPSDQRPAITFFHGGGWHGGGVGQFSAQGRYLALRGMVAFTAEYRCIKDFKTTPQECVKDGKSVVRWIRQHAAELGIDPSRIAAGGGSAGGHIAAATALSKGFEEEGEDRTTSCRPDALVLYNPVFDNGPKGFGHAVVKDYWKDFSPIDNIDAHAPPAIVFLGTKDQFIPVETGQRFERLMKKGGVRCDLHLYEDKPHGFFNIWVSREDMAITIVEMDRFLTSLGYLKGDPILDAKLAAVVPPRRIKVVCVGDSITYGHGIPDRDNNSYPAQLGERLGKGWEVSNFGETGHTLLKKGNAPYARSKQYKNALASKPDVVVIMLGTNDSKPDNWNKKGEYIGDYLALIESFRNLDSKPAVWICNPVPVFPERWGITDKVVLEEIIPRIQAVAQKAGVPVIDLHTPFQNRSALFPDKVHPNAAGAAEMAKIIAALLSEYGAESPQFRHQSTILKSSAQQGTAARVP